MTRKEIARRLDEASERADAHELTPATPRQCWFLAGLMERAGCGDVAVLDLPTHGGPGYEILTRMTASRAILLLQREVG